MIHASYDLSLVALSVAVACVAAWTALSLSTRMLQTEPLARDRWLAGAAIVMGIGIWTMHFTAMLAFSIPMPVRYRLDLTLLSMIFAIAGTAAAFFLLSRRSGPRMLVVSGVFMGTAIVAMHYTGMAAFTAAARLSYSPTLVVLSWIIAVVASTVALLTAFRSTNPESAHWRALSDPRIRAAAAVILGGAVSGMHYTGMAAVTVWPGEARADGAVYFDSAALATATIAAVLALAAVSFVATRGDRRIAEMAEINRRLQDANEHRDVLVHELSHRVRNTIAVVQSVAMLTARRVESIPEFLEQFSGRLNALAGAHALLAESDWRDTSVSDVVAGALAPFRTRSGAFAFSGPDLRISPNGTQALSLALHELATNAVKYGGLSSPTGRISVTWSSDDEQLRLSWIERGGPPIETRPKREGFGTTMLRRLIEDQLSGLVTVKYASAGLECDIVLPLTPGQSRRPSRSASRVHRAA